MGNRIKEWSKSVEAAASEIAEFQNGLRRPMDSGCSHLNENSMGGLYNGDFIVIGGLPSMGKTYLLSQVENYIMEKNQSVALLRYNFEMSVKKLILRTLKLETGFRTSDILLKPPVDQQLFDNIIRKEMNPRISHVEEKTTPEEFSDDMDEFLTMNSHLPNVLVSIDHMALFKRGKDGKKDAIDQVVETIIEKKQKFKNVTFLGLSQLNRDILKRTNPAEAAPIMSDFYASSTISFAADIIMVTHRPQLLGFEKYMYVNRDMYEHLSDFFCEGGSSTHVSLDTTRAIFYHYLKLRTIDGDISFTDVFAEYIGTRPEKNKPLSRESDNTLNDF